MICLHTIPGAISLHVTRGWPKERLPSTVLLTKKKKKKSGCCRPGAVCVLIKKEGNY